MLAKINTGTTVGLDGVLIEVEVDVASRGFPTFNLVGLPNKAVEEAKDRVRTAIANTNFEMPDSRITVNLAPADIPKTGSSFDLPIAIGILAASGSIDKNNLSHSLFTGELSLEGNIRAVPGIISVAMMAKEKQLEHLFVPAENAREAALVTGITVYPVQSLADVILHLNGEKMVGPYCLLPEDVPSTGQYDFDFADIKGQYQTKRALEIAAAGFHNIHLKGVPGAGKTMLSRAFPSILPPMDPQEILEVSRIYSVMGMLKRRGYTKIRPFRSPHHTTSCIGLIGGGTIPMPGEVSLAHRGVLFLDELPEFPRVVLEALRQPLEDGRVSISRAMGSLTFPSRFLLLAASNPCPCGYLGHPTKKCNCLPGSIIKYRKKLSGPLLDRIDIHVSVPPVDQEKLISAITAESSGDVLKRVTKARKIQLNRFASKHLVANGEMTPKDIKIFCSLSRDALMLLKQAISKFSLSARSYFKIIKISQTIADLAGEPNISPSHVAEALQYRAQEDV